MRKGKYFYLYTHYYWIQWTDQITKTIDETTTTMRNTCTYLPWNQAFIFCLATPKHPKNVKKKNLRKKKLKQNTKISQVFFVIHYQSRYC